MNILKKIIGLVLGLIVVVVVAKVVVAIILIAGVLIFGDSAADNLMAVGNIAGLLLGVWLGVKVWQSFAKEKKPPQPKVETHLP